MVNCVNILLGPLKTENCCCCIFRPIFNVLFYEMIRGSYHAALPIYIFSVRFLIVFILASFMNSSESWVSLWWKLGEAWVRQECDRDVDKKISSHFFVYLMNIDEEIKTARVFYNTFHLLFTTWMCLLSYSCVEPVCSTFYFIFWVELSWLHGSLPPIF